MAHIALEISQSDSQAISGYADAVLHITMCHLGKITWLQSRQIVQGLQAQDDVYRPPVLKLRATDFVIFGSPEEPCLVRKVVCDNYDLEGARQRLAVALESLGVFVSKTYDPWIPHVTVGLGKHGSTYFAQPDAHFEVRRIGLFAAPLILHWSFPLGE